MQAFNVEIFDRSMTMRPGGHFTIGEINHNEDYLSLPENAVAYTEAQLQITGGDYIRISGNGQEYFGVIQEPLQGKEESVVRFKSFLSLFDAQILFDTTLQGSGTALEDVIAQYITDGWISNADSAQNIPGLSVATLSATTEWGFNLKSDVEGMAKAIVNFQAVIMQRALASYYIGVYAVPDFDAKTITLQIGIKQQTPITVETMLANVLEKTVIVDQASFTTNKAIIYDRKTMTDPAIYYLHPDGAVDQSDTNRITPVVYKMTTIDSDDFATAAKEEAERMLVTNIKNLAEITVLNTDPLAGLEVGQRATIITATRTIGSVLTGKNVGKNTRLIFGTIRLDLTVLLKQQTKGA